MASCRTWLRYAGAKLHASIDLAVRSFEEGSIKPEQMLQKAAKNLFLGHLTFTHSYKGKEMAPTFSSEGATLLMRPSLGLAARHVHVGDIVLFQDPREGKNQDKLLVRRIAAKEGDEMLSTDVNDKPFDLEKGYYWVLSDNETLNAKDAIDSRTFGPIDSSDILGRAIYFYVSHDEHGPVQNSEAAKELDFPVLAAELDIERLSKQS